MPRSSTASDEAEGLAPAAESPGSVQTRRLALAALGVVFGDIGTSPLYALRECFRGEHGVAPTPENVLGILSLFFWALTAVIVVKYLSFVMRADNQGEGGVLALLALGHRLSNSRGRRVRLLIGLAGAALLYGESMITPAISVLSAVEGLEVAAPQIHALVVPFSLLVLIALFAFQRRGTAAVGAWFGPITAVWFAAIAAAGVPWILREPSVLAALNPLYGARVLMDNPAGVLVLGAVVLCITGGEALYADMGHLGRRPIALAWYGVVFPALLINYFGQGALLLHNPGIAQGNPFYALVRPELVLPMTAVATLATTVASQAVISGSYSVTRQAIQLGYLPRMRIVHTSAQAEGQVYMPGVNTALLLACLALVVGFGGSSRLAAAYGIAVTGAMTATTLLYLPTARERLGPGHALGLGALFLTVDLAFLGACLVKFADGGWFPILTAAGLFAVMTTWRRGADLLSQQLSVAALPLDAFIDDVRRTKPPRARGTAVFMSGQPGGLPVALGHHFKLTGVLHERVVLLTVSTVRVPLVPLAERVEIEDLGEGFLRVQARYGFLQTPRIRDVLRGCALRGLELEVQEASFFLGRVTVLRSARRQIAPWRHRLFSFLHHNAQPAFEFFGIPPGRVVELGLQVQL
jgi:KUP system potassium uptake protein